MFVLHSRLYSRLDSMSSVRHCVLLKMFVLGRRVVYLAGVVLLHDDREATERSVYLLLKQLIEHIAHCAVRHEVVLVDSVIYR
jgi:hypothetical protein